MLVHVLCFCTERRSPEVVLGSVAKTYNSVLRSDSFRTGSSSWLSYIHEKLKGSKRKKYGIQHNDNGMPPPTDRISNMQIVHVSPQAITWSWPILKQAERTPG